MYGLCVLNDSLKRTHSIENTFCRGHILWTTQSKGFNVRALGFNESELGGAFACQVP